MPICRVCKQQKSVPEMASDRRIQRGYTTICKECDSTERGKYYRANKQKKQDYDLQRNYGITLTDYDRMEAQQGGRCAICGSDNPGRGKSRFAVDHCHVTGQVRALLCQKCNHGLGLTATPMLLRKAADYLEAFKEEA